MMKIASLAAALVLAAPFASAVGLTHVDLLATQKACKGLYKDVLTCAAQKNWVSGQGWNATITCVDTFAPQIAQCRRATWQFLPAFGNLPDVGAMVGISKSGYVDGYYITPGVVVKTVAAATKTVYPLNCKVCSHFIAKKLKCALPVTATAALTPLALNVDLNTKIMANCLPAPNDWVLWGACTGATGNLATVNLVPNASNQTTFVHANPLLAVADLDENCPAVEATVSSKGVVSANVLKGNAFQVQIP